MKFETKKNIEYYTGVAENHLTVKLKHRPV